MKCNKGSFVGEVCAFMGPRDFIACNCILTGKKCVDNIKSEVRSFDTILIEICTLMGMSLYKIQDIQRILMLCIKTKLDIINDIKNIIRLNYYSISQKIQFMKLLAELKEEEAKSTNTILRRN